MLVLIAFSAIMYFLNAVRHLCCHSVLLIYEKNKAILRDIISLHKIFKV